MQIVGIDISKKKFDACLLTGEHTRQSVFSNTEAGFDQFWCWLDRYRSDKNTSVHVCLEATGNWGLDLAAFLHDLGTHVSIINPARVKAFGQSELIRNKTDKLDAALIARFCRAHNPPPWTPPATHLRELRELVRRCDALKMARTQEMNRKQAGFVSAAVKASIDNHLEWLNTQITSTMEAALKIIADDTALAKNFDLIRSITGFGDISSVVLLAEIPNIADFTPKGLAAFVGLSPREHRSGTSIFGSNRISRVGDSRLRSLLYMCALTAKRKNIALAPFVQRMIAAGKPAKVILVAVARKLLCYAHIVVKTQQPFNPSKIDKKLSATDLTKAQN